MKKQIHVVGAVIMENGKIFCAQRGNTRSLAYKWEFPGGKIDEGEAPQEALKREITEEMNCRIDVGNKVEHTIHEYDFGVVHLTTYLCTLVQGQPQLSEHVDMMWLTPAQLDQLDWAEADIPAVEKLKNMFI